jgi:hypothetical protein
VVSKVGGTFPKFWFLILFVEFTLIYIYIYIYIITFVQFLCHNIEKIRLKRNIGTHAIAKINKSSFSTTIMKTLHFSSLSPQTMKQSKANKLVDNRSWTVKHWQKISCIFGQQHLVQQNFSREKWHTILKSKMSILDFFSSCYTLHQGITGKKKLNNPPVPYVG